jgi:hypothetical protein
MLRSTPASERGSGMVGRLKRAQGLAVLALLVLAPDAFAGDADKSLAAPLCVVERNDLWNASFLKCCTPSAQAGGSCRFEADGAVQRRGRDNSAFVNFSGGSAF